MITREIKVWIGAAQGIIPPVKVSQYDTEWQFVFTVYKDDVVWDMSGVSTVSLNGVKEDGTAFVYAGSISSGHVVVDCGKQMTSAAGRVECELRFFTSYGKVISTANFRLLVEQAPMTGYRASGSDFDELAQLINAALEGIPAWVAEHLTDEAAAQSALDAAASAAEAAGYAEAAADVVPTLHSEMLHMGVKDFLWPPTAPASGSGGLTYTIDPAAMSVSISGTTTAAVSFRRLYNNAAALPAWAEAGKTYWARINSDKVWLEVWNSGSRIFQTQTSGKFTIPNDAVGLLIRLAVYGTGTEVDEIVYPTISESMIAPELEQAIPAQIDAAMAPLGLEELLWKITPTVGNPAGLTYTVNDDHTITVDGTTTNISWLICFASSTSLPDWAIPGHEYHARINSPSGKIKLQVWEYRENVSGSTNIFSTTTNGTFRVAEDAVGLIIRIAVTASDIEIDNETVAPSITIAPTPDELAHYRTPRVMFFGDSITRGINSDPPANAFTEVNLPNLMTAELGYQIDNYGIGSIGWLDDASDHRGRAIDYLQRVGDPDWHTGYTAIDARKFHCPTRTWADYNTVILAFGANDRAATIDGISVATQLGSLEDIDDTKTYEEVMAETPTTIVDAMYQCYRYIREQAPEINIILSDPLLQKVGQAPRWSYPTRRDTDSWSWDELNEMYAAFAARYGLGHMSHYDAPINRIDPAISLRDSVHPTKACYRQLARHFAGKLSALVL